MSLLDALNQDLKAAMLSKDVIARDTIRMLISDIKKFEIDERVEADDSKIANLINKNVKQRRDSIEQFKNGGRDDLVATEQNQLDVILKYLPEQLSEEEIHALIQEAITAVSAETAVIASWMSAWISSSDNCSGKYFRMTSSWFCSVATRSSRPPFLNCSMESLRCLTFLFIRLAIFESSASTLSSISNFLISEISILIVSRAITSLLSIAALRS